MKKDTRLPREEAAGGGGFLPTDTDSDVEGHRQGEPVDEFAPRLPGTGGDHHRRPSDGGELDDHDVEGHGLGNPGDYTPRQPGTGGERYTPRQPGTGGDRYAPRLPGTGGDHHRRPSGGGELGDDVEGHA